MKRNVVSLFSSSGIGDLGIRANNLDTVIACELMEERMQLFSHNFPDTKTFCGDIWELSDDIIEYYKKNYPEPPFIVMATPPCQGMSSNGMGKMLSDYRKGVRPKFDERNRLIIPAIKIIKELQPEWIIFENVANMTNTLILDDSDELVNIIDYIHKELGKEYVGEPQVINFADFGVPQHRKRLVTILSKTKRGTSFYKQNKTFLPEPTHKNNWTTLKEVIGDLPPLRAEKGKNFIKGYNVLHQVPILDEKKLFWLDNTPEGDTAFNNQCINPLCMYSNNTKHGASKDRDGINKFNKDTPLYCEKCGEVLPRPWVEDKETGIRRIMKGYVSAYKRMSWDEPASTLTQNFQFACSDKKVHPCQSRVLSLLEGTLLQTIADYDYSFTKEGKLMKVSLIRDTIGESVPPIIIDIICKNILKIEHT